MRVLVIEDEPDLLRVLAQSLREAGYATDEAMDGHDGLSKASSGAYDAIILDIMLPRMDGFAVLRELRKSKTTPVLILTARDAIPDRVQGLNAGADDYLTKPFELSELLARVRALMRRAAGGALSVVEMGEVTVDSLARTVSKLDLARRIQMCLTPQQPPPVPGVDMAFHYQPAQYVGGDYCDFWLLPDGRLAFVVADVAGKGLPAAMVMANLHAALHAGTAFCTGPATAVDYVNRQLVAQHLPEGLFITLFLGVLDAANGRLEYVNAGHMPPLLLTGGTVHTLDASSDAVLGVGTEPFIAKVQMLAPGAGLLAVTDGVTDAESPEGELFGIAGVETVARSAGAAGAHDLVRAVATAASAFRGAGPQQDDMTILGLRWKAGES